MVGAAHGNDGGGSIRIPASCCGLVGLKPARGRNPLGPELGDVYGGLLAEHVLTRSVRDSAVLLDITSGPDSGDPYFAPPPEGTFESHAGRTPRRLRIGFSTEPPAGGRVDPACVEAVARTVRFCEELGHELEEASPDFDAAAMFDAFLELWSDGNAWMLERAIARVGREPREDELEPLTRALAEAGRSRSAAAHLHTRRRLQELSRDVAAFFERYDLWLTPTLAEPPVPLGTFAPNEEDPMQTMERDGEFSPFTPVANVTGQPAISLPLGWTDGNLPIGVHFTARAGEEGTLIELAAQLEEAVGWRSRRPPAAEPAGLEAR
jgi:amidase